MPHHDHVSFSQGETHNDHKKHTEIPEAVPLKQKIKSDPTFSIETSKLDEEEADQDISNLIEKKQKASSTKSVKKTAVKKEKKKEKKKESKKKDEDLGFTIETTKMDFPVDDVRE